MTTKDWIYLGFIALTALAFYCNGFYAGVLRCRKAYEVVLRDFEMESEESVQSSAHEIRNAEDPLLFRGPIRQNVPGIPGRRLPGGFQNN